MNIYHPVVGGEILDVVNIISMYWLTYFGLFWLSALLMPYFVWALPLYGLLTSLGVDHKIFLWLTFDLPIMNWQVQQVISGFPDYDPDAKPEDLANIFYFYWAELQPWILAAILSVPISIVFWLLWIPVYVFVIWTEREYGFE